MIERINSINVYIQKKIREAIANLKIEDVHSITKRTNIINVYIQKKREEKP